MATAAVAAPQPRKGFWRSIGEGARRAGDAIASVARRGWRWTKSAASSVKGWLFGAARVVSRATMTTMRWLWVQVAFLPSIFMRGVGWVLRIASWGFQAALITVTLFFLLFAFVGAGVGYAEERYNDNVHARIVNIAKGEPVFTDSRRPQMYTETPLSPDEVVVITDLEGFSKGDPGLEWFGEDAVKAVFGPQKRPLDVPATVDEAMAQFLWTKLQDEYPMETHLEKNSYFRGRETATQEFRNRPQEMMAANVGQFVAMMMKTVDQANQLGIKTHKAGYRRGLQEELVRLKAKYAENPEQARVNNPAPPKQG